MNTKSKDDLENRFHRAMAESIEVSRREVNYNPSYFAQMVGEHGGVGAAKRLLASDKMTTGFTELYMAGRLDLTVEAHVVKKTFTPLFTEEEIRRACQVLEEHHYQFSEDDVCQ